MLELFCGNLVLTLGYQLSGITVTVVQWECICLNALDILSGIQRCQPFQLKFSALRCSLLWCNSLY